jgi:hypothetical protein
MNAKIEGTSNSNQTAQINQQKTETVKTGQLGITNVQSVPPGDDRPAQLKNDKAAQDKSGPDKSQKDPGKDNKQPLNLSPITIAIEQNEQQVTNNQQKQINTDNMRNLQLDNMNQKQQYDIRQSEQLQTELNDERRKTLIS